MSSLTSSLNIFPQDVWFQTFLAVLLMMMMMMMMIMIMMIMMMMKMMMKMVMMTHQEESCRQWRGANHTAGCSLETEQIQFNQS